MSTAPLKPVQNPKLLRFQQFVGIEMLHHVVRESGCGAPNGHDYRVRRCHIRVPAENENIFSQRVFRLLTLNERSVGVC